MTLTITIELDNAAFDEGPEAGRILTELAKTVDDMEPGDSASLCDLNGNVVGKAVVC
jgi:hypothetical protein